MTTSLASQLQRIKPFVQSEAAGGKRPFTRPSIIFDPKEAADIDLETILSIALSGLEALMRADERFNRYKDTLFSLKSSELDREAMGIEENKKIDTSIGYYLRLLSGYLQLPSAMKTLEYLIRRYKVHIYNVDELVLCALPYHDTHAFVRIVQVLELGNKKWAFLGGVKASGAPPPRKVIVQQCIRDMEVLENICNYAMPTNKFQHSRPVICFCSAVVVETLGAIPTLDTDSVKRILPFVFAGLNSGQAVSPDHKAAAMMIVGLLATRTTLAMNLIQQLILLIAKVTRRDAKESADLPWLRTSIMTMISLFQSQPVERLLKNVVEILNEIRDLPSLLIGLNEEFHIEKFLLVYLEALVDFSSFDDSCHLTLITILETLLVKDFVHNIVTRVLNACTKLSEKKESHELCKSGFWAKQILGAIDKHYPVELRRAVHKFLELPKMKSEKYRSIFENLCLMLDGSSGMPLEITDSKIWFALEHPKAEIRRASLLGLSSADTLKANAFDALKLVNVREAILRRLNDDDLGVVQAALSLNGLSAIIDPLCLLKAFEGVLLRCIDILAGTSSTSSQACDVAVLCLEAAVSLQEQHSDLSKGVATLVFPLLLILPKTWRLNLKALEVTGRIKWSFYTGLLDEFNHIITSPVKKFEPSFLAAVNKKTVGVLAENFSTDPVKWVSWLFECYSSHELSKTLFFLVILQLFMKQNEVTSSFPTLFQALFSVLKREWCEMEFTDFSVEEFKKENMDKACAGVMDLLFDLDNGILNSNILICLYWSLLRSFGSISLTDLSADDGELLGILQDLFVLSATSPLKHIFEENLHVVSKKSHAFVVRFLSKFFTEEGFSVTSQVESLHCFVILCSALISSKKNGINTSRHIQLLLEFPLLLVPLFNKNQAIRIVALKCIEGLLQLWHSTDITNMKNGNDFLLAHSAVTHALGDVLELIVSQKELISSNENFLPALLTSMLGFSEHSLLVPQNIDRRLNQDSKDAILTFILRSSLNLSAHGKLMILSLLKGIGSAILEVEEIQSLLSELLKRRSGFHIELDESLKQLSQDETETLCLLLQACACAANLSEGDVIIGYLLKALQVGRSHLDDPAIVRPCATVLQKLTSNVYNCLRTEIQDELLRELIILLHKDNRDIQDAARDALQQINVCCPSMHRLLDLVLQQEVSVKVKRNKPMKDKKFFLQQDLSNRGENMLIFLRSLLDVLLLKKSMESRAGLLRPLFELLRKVSNGDWLPAFFVQDDNGSRGSSDISSINDSISDIQQTVLLILEDIVASLGSDLHNQDEMLSKSDVNLLVQCARTAKDATTRNHIFLLLSSIAKVASEWILDHIIDIVTIVGDSAITQSDSHSQHVFEGLMSTMVSCGLSKSDNAKLLQIFVNVLPEIAEHRRLTIIVYLLRILGEKKCLGTLLGQLFHSLVLRTTKSSADGTIFLASLPSVATKEWEYAFAVQICEQYSCAIWLSSLVILLQETGVSYQHEKNFELLLSCQFILQKLQDTEIAFVVESGQDAVELQRTLGALMESVVSHMVILNIKRKEIKIPANLRKALRDCMDAMLKTITKNMVPSEYFRAMALLLGHDNGDVKKKAFGLLCETLKERDIAQRKHMGSRKRNTNFISEFHMDANAWESVNNICLKIVQLLDDSTENSNTSVKLAAVSAVEILAIKFSSNNASFSECLSAVARHIGSDDFAISSSCLRSTGSLIHVLGPKALSELPLIMQNTFRRVHDVSSCSTRKFGDSYVLVSSEVSHYKESLLLSILVTLEAVVDKLGCFLSPYLEDILELMVIHPEYVSESYPKLKVKADSVRRLLTEKIPVRLVLMPLMKIYAEAVKCGESSVSVTFEMLASTIMAMDRLSVGTYHAKVFEQCLLALDLRRQHPISIADIDMVEQSVIHAIIVLTKKLTENMFRPLFIQSLEWAESDPESSGSNISRNLERSISFYKLVDKLIEQHRSLFVPYFKYLLDGCTRYLTDDQEGNSSEQKRKKAKVHAYSGSRQIKGSLSPSQWHLRALILLSLKKCFLYDTGSLRFLDSSNFQVLLKPIVSQLVAEPPASLEQFPNIQTVEQVDDILVSCLGQMAMTAGSDLLWKPLNHEVLMQTRSDKIRPRMLGLKIVSYLVEHLKEEYLVFLPETIPFLAELLEDADLSVKTLAQETLKEMETLSGENLRDYL